MGLVEGNNYRKPPYFMRNTMCFSPIHWNHKKQRQVKLCCATDIHVCCPVKNQPIYRMIYIYIIMYNRMSSNVMYVCTCVYIYIHIYKYNDKKNKQNIHLLQRYHSIYTDWWFQPLWKIWKSDWIIIPTNYWEKEKPCSKPPTSNMCIYPIIFQFQYILYNLIKNGIFP